MSNFFDQFDSAPAGKAPAPAPTAPAPGTVPAVAAATGGNFFDQFDKAPAQAEVVDPQYEQLLKDNPEAAGMYLMGKQAVGAIPTVINAGATTAGAVIGGAAGTAAAPGVGTALGGAAGAYGGNIVGQNINQALGFQATPTSYGQAAGAAITGAFPGESLAGAGAGQVLGAMTKGALVNAAAAGTQGLVDEGKLPTSDQMLLAAAGGAGGALVSKVIDSGMSGTAQEARSQATLNASKDASIAEGKAAGYVVPPFETRPNSVNDAVGSLGGKAAIKQQAAIDNQVTTNKLAAQSVGLNPGKALSIDALQGVRDKANEVYEAVGSMSPNAAQDLQALKDARLDVKDYAKQYAVDQRRDTQLLMQKASDLADSLETRLDTHARAYDNWVQAGKPQGTAANDWAKAEADQVANPVPGGMVQNLRAARTLISKTHVVQGALNDSNGEVSANIIGRLYDRKPGLLTGELATIGKFDQALEGRYTGLGSSTPKPAVSALNPVVALGTTVAGANAHGAKGAVAGALASAAYPIAKSGARSFMLSNAVQSGLLSRLSAPSYGPAYADITAQLARLGLMNTTQPQPSSIPAYLLPNK